MSKEDHIEAEGVVIEVLRGAHFRVKLPNGHIVQATISGKLRTNYIKVLVGDSVKLNLSPYNLSMGSITWRSKG
jgi:translation initiation factor IF-1